MANNISRWDPMREMMSLRSAMDRLFDTAYIGPQMAWAQETWDLPMDVSENEDEYLVRASLPGIKPEDLEITFNNNVLTIKGETKEETETKEEKYHLRERRYGTFSRSITLPSSVKADGINADYKDGVLVLHLPKAEEAKPRRITVRADGSRQRMIEGQSREK